MKKSTLSHLIGKSQHYLKKSTFCRHFCNFFIMYFMYVSFYIKMKM